MALAGPRAVSPCLRGRLGEARWPNRVLKRRLRYRHEIQDQPMRNRGVRLLIQQLCPPHGRAVGRGRARCVQLPAGTDRNAAAPRQPRPMTRVRSPTPQLTAVRSITTRSGLAREKTLNSTGSVRSTTNRVTSAYWPTRTPVTDGAACAPTATTAASNSARAAAATRRRHITPLLRLLPALAPLYTGNRPPS